MNTIRVSRSSQTGHGRSNLEAEEGKPFPVGATVVDGGVNFCVFSKNATGMELVLFPSERGGEITTFRLDPEKNRSGLYWHAFVAGIGAGQEYGFRADGPYSPGEGMRFNPRKLLVDPYARAIKGWDAYDRAAAVSGVDNLDCALRSVVVDNKSYDWEDDTPLKHPYAESVVYEMHVGGFTRHATSGLDRQKRGTFAGVIQKIPYLKQLGVTAVELMPVQEFDPVASQPGMANYWGYSTVGFFAPHHGYCVDGDPVKGMTEFRDMVKALHKAGIEVILDVVFNHTAEGNENGPTLSFKGLDNSIYYLLEPDNRACYSNYSGCGNTFNANHPVAGRLVVDALRYWVSEMHVDGFRFDLAAALVRDVYGRPNNLPALLWVIESDPILSNVKLIAEAWDAAGLYRVGWFVNTSNRYAEWNGPFRDDVRRFIKGDPNTVPGLAARITASSDIYVNPNREANRTVNFITCHDGFTLYDLVAYNGKHNGANLENNRDGNDSNYSWNCGVEGPTDSVEVEQLRMRQMKNFYTVLFLSQGTPMVLMGDEAARTQAGNNNAYCHDNELTWFDWSLLEKNSELYDFVKNLINFTQSLEIFRERKPISVAFSSSQAYISFHGVKIGEPDWGSDSHSLAFTMHHEGAGECLHAMLNSYWEPLTFQLPELDAKHVWKVALDTSSSNCAIPSGTPVVGDTYTVMPRTSAVLMMMRVD